MWLRVAVAVAVEDGRRFAADADVGLAAEAAAAAFPPLLRAEARDMRDARIACSAASPETVPASAAARAACPSIRPCAMHAPGDPKRHPA